MAIYFFSNIFLTVDSIIGALSIIGSVILRKQVASPKVLVLFHNPFSMIMLVALHYRFIQSLCYRWPTVC